MHIYNLSVRCSAGIIFNTRVAEGSTKATIEMCIVARVLILIPVMPRIELFLELKDA